MRFVVLLLWLAAGAYAECVARLPTAGGNASVRVVSGLQASSTDFDNVVTIAVNTDEGRDYSCVGSLIAPEWVITAAQCFIDRRNNFVLRGTSSLTGEEFEIFNTFIHPGWFEAGQTVHRDDIQLLQLSRPVRDAVQGSPTPSPSPAPGTEPQPAPVATSPAPNVLPTVNTNFNFMYINNNSQFAMDQPRYLRLKGYGITTQPSDASEPLRFRSRDLKIADLRTAPCDDSFGTDGTRRLCTKQDDACGACYGDTGAPLYDVDKSGTFSVLVGIVTFGTQSTSYEDPICTGERPVAYTAVGFYANWIRETIKRETGEERVFFFDLPREGITNTDLQRDSSPLAIFATTSVIVISCLAVLGTLVAVLITCILRRLRKNRKRWIEGLQAEESFVKAGEKDAVIVDPFEGIQNDQQPRFSFTGFPRAAVKGATEFSARSIGMLKAFIAREKDEDFFEPREPIVDAPIWLPGAWDRLFMPPSKKDLQKIHKIATQRVVDDVLSGADKSVELSLEEVAFKNKRDEANLEAAWAKLEIQTSLRNLSEVGGSATKAFSPSMMSPSLTPTAASPRKGSRNSSRAFSPLGSGKRKPGDITKTDALLAAFASIDAESEQVAEETAIDSSALQALAEAKRPNVLATLRRKFSSGLSSPGTRSNDRESDGEELRAFGSVRGDGGASRDSRGPSRLVASGSRLPSRASSRVPTSLSSTSGLLTKTSLGSRHSSMLMDYFSEDYNLSGSSSDDDEHVSFEDMFDTNSRRFTEDRKPQTQHESRSILSFRSTRKSQNRSFESLERKDSSSSLPDSQDTDDSDNLAVRPRERWGAREEEKTEPSRSMLGKERYDNLPMSTSSVSSDKRPRSLATYSKGGSNSQTQAYSEIVNPSETQVFVHMEGEPLVAKESSFPDRAEYYQSNRTTPADVPSFVVQSVDKQDEKSTSSGGSLSVLMEEETSYAGRQRSHAQNAEKSETKTTRGRHPWDHASPETTEENVSVHMEDASMSTRPVGMRGKTTLLATPRSPITSGSTPRQNASREDQVSVHMEEAPSDETGRDTKLYQDRTNRTEEQTTKSARPVAENMAYRPPTTVERDMLPVHMEDETSTHPSVRARITAFDQSEEHARQLSDSSSSPLRSNVSVAKLKNMWNEIARRNSEEGS